MTGKQGAGPLPRPLPLSSSESAGDLPWACPLTGCPWAAGSDFCIPAAGALSCSVTPPGERICLLSGGPVSPLGPRLWSQTLGPSCPSPASVWELLVAPKVLRAWGFWRHPPLPLARPGSLPHLLVCVGGRQVEGERGHWSRSPWCRWDWGQAGRLGGAGGCRQRPAWRARRCRRGLPWGTLSEPCSVLGLGSPGGAQPHPLWGNRLLLPHQQVVPSLQLRLRCRGLAAARWPQAPGREGGGGADWVGWDAWPRYLGVI